MSKTDLVLLPEISIPISCMTWTTIGFNFPGSSPALVALEYFAAEPIQKRLSHLAASAVMDTDENDPLLSHSYAVALN